MIPVRSVFIFCFRRSPVPREILKKLNYFSRYPSLHHPAFIKSDQLNTVPDRPVDPFLTGRPSTRYESKGFSFPKILKPVFPCTPVFHTTWYGAVEYVVVVWAGGKCYEKRLLFFGSPDDKHSSQKTNKHRCWQGRCWEFRSCVGFGHRLTTGDKHTAGNKVEFILQGH